MTETRQQRIDRLFNELTALRQMADEDQARTRAAWKEAERVEAAIGAEYRVARASVAWGAPRFSVEKWEAAGEVYERLFVAQKVTAAAWRLHTRVGRECDAIVEEARKALVAATREPTS
jgi:hypothetical protein